MFLHLFNQLSALRCALAHGELEEAAALAAQVDGCDLGDLFLPRDKVWAHDERRHQIKVTKKNWPVLRLTTEQFDAIRGDREFHESTWFDFAEAFAVSPDHRALFADNAADMDGLDWPKLFARVLDDCAWDKAGIAILRIFLQERGRDLLEAVPIATYATTRAPPDRIVECVRDTFGAGGLEWFTLEVVRYVVCPKVPKIRRGYAGELLKEIAKLYPRLAIDVNVELKP